MTVSPSYINIGPGQTDLEELADMPFYGVRQNTETSGVTIDKIYGDEPISLPDAYTVRKNDYRNWVWTYNTLQFYWGENGRLLMEVL